MANEVTRLALVLVGLWAVRAIACAQDQVPEGSRLSLVGVAEQGGVAYVSLFDYASGEHFLPSTKSPDGGYELVSVSEDQNAVVRHNGETYLLRLGWLNPATPVSDAASHAGVQVPNISRPGADEFVAPTPPPGAKLPLVFQSGDLTALNLTAEQKAIITRLRGQFLAALGLGGDSDPAASASTEANAATPTAIEAASSAVTSSATASVEQWNSDQEHSDEIFRMLFGTQAFNAYEMGLGTKH